MTRDDIIKLVRQVIEQRGGSRIDDEDDLLAYSVELVKLVSEHVAAAAVASEREACAKVCDDIDTEYEGEDVLATWCAAAIRARGEATSRGQA